jgi:hypothetical protein
VDPAVRSAIAERLQAGRVVAVHLEPHDCNTSVEVLRCTRATAYGDAPVSYPPESKKRFKRIDLERATEIAGAGSLVARVPIDRFSFLRVLRLEVSKTGARQVSWWLDVTRTMTPSRYGPMAEGPAPSLFAEDLAGPDCRRITHWADAVELGAYRVLAEGERGDRSEDKPLDASECQPPSCSEPIAVRLRELPLRPGHLSAALAERWPSLLSLVRSIETRGCPAPLPGAKTEQAEQAARLFDGEKWGDAALAAARVATGETGDDEGNRWIAEYMVAVSVERLGAADAANRALAHTAALACHPRRAQAAFWMTVLERRAQRLN